MEEQIIPDDSTGNAITPTELDTYGFGFFGYGNWNADYWLIGLEERGAAVADEFSRRFTAWKGLYLTQQQRNDGVLVDLRSFHAAWQNQNHPEQPDWNNPTWNALKALCEQAGFDAGTLNDQNGRWGANNQHTINLIEAMPFPAHTTREWPYTEHEQHKWNKFGIQTRQLCAQKYLNMRFEQLARKLNRHRPKVVVLYGRAYCDDLDVRVQWQGVVNTTHQLQHNEWESGYVKPNPGNRSHYCWNRIVWPNDAQTLLVCVAQPASIQGQNAKNIQKEVFQLLGKKVFQLLNPA